MKDTILYSPSLETITSSNIYAFAQWVNERYGEDIQNYASLHRWSLQAYPRFWEDLMEYFDVGYSGHYDKVMQGRMPQVKWFEGITLNYGQEMEIRSSNDQPLIYHFDEQNTEIRAISQESFFSQSKSVACYLDSLGLEVGDTVAAYVANIPEAAIACHAAISKGLIWSSCSLDFGADAVIERFSLIQPKVLFVVTAYSYNGKIHDRKQELAHIIKSLPDLKCVIEIPYLSEATNLPESILWDEVVSHDNETFYYQRVPFDHPIWVLYSSGTTGKPKAITHRHGGMLLEHLKYLILQNDVKPGEKFFWYSTTGWMMWNFAFASILTGASLVIYEGSPALGGIDFLWKKASELGLEHFGTSAPFLIACMKNGFNAQAHNINLENLRTIGSTGSPLPPEAFAYVYKDIKQDLFLCSMSGGTDICSAFVGSNMWSPVYEGYIQCIGLGVDLVSLDENENEVIGDVGEMYIQNALPNMPVYFWNDDDYSKYSSSYFDGFEGKWRHGDWILKQDHGGLLMLGRSDSTLNRNGVRIGTAEIYNALNDVTEITDSLVVNIERKDGSSYMPLFVIVKEGQLQAEIIQKINQILKSKCSPRHVPDEIIQVADIPYTISGKKMETPVKKILMGYPEEKAYTKDAMRNHESMQYFVKFAEDLKS